MQIVDAADLLATEAFVSAAHRILADLVRDGAALGWVEPPTLDDVSLLMKRLAEDVASRDAAVRAAYRDDRLLGVGYWRRYTRPTHRFNADLERLAVAARAQRAGVGRRITKELIGAARAAGIEVLTLDVRGDNQIAMRLYRSMGFVEYGRLHEFVAVGDQRYDKHFFSIDLRERG